MIRVILLCLIVLQILGVKPPRSGPFKTSIVRLNHCNKPSRPFVKNPDELALGEGFLRNTTKGVKIDGNITVLRDVRNVEVKVQSYRVLQNGTMVLNYAFNSVNCKGTIFLMLLNVLNVRLDRKTCTYRKGSYIFKDIDVDKGLHIWRKTMEYGNVMSQYEALVPAGVVLCREVFLLVEPAKKNKY